MKTKKKQKRTTKKTNKQVSIEKVFDRFKPRVYQRPQSPLVIPPLSEKQRIKPPYLGV